MLRLAIAVAAQTSVRWAAGKHGQRSAPGRARPPTAGRGVGRPRAARTQCMPPALCRPPPRARAPAAATSRGPAPERRGELRKGGAEHAAAAGRAVAIRTPCARGQLPIGREGPPEEQGAVHNPPRVAEPHGSPSPARHLSLSQVRGREP